MIREFKTLDCIAVDDEDHALDILEMYIAKTPFLNLVYRTNSPWDAIKYLGNEQVDLMFLDIQMEELTGMQLMDINANKCPVILTTAYSEYALKSYEYSVADYLLKPYSYARFLKAVSGLQQIVKEKETPQLEKQTKESESIFVKGDTKNKYHRIALNDIQYIEGLRNYVRFHCREQQFITLQNLKILEEQLSDKAFFRIHKSYIISLDQIEQVDGNSVLINNIRLPIGRSYRKQFFDHLEERMM